MLNRISMNVPVVLCLILFSSFVLTQRSISSNQKESSQAIWTIQPGRDVSVEAGMAGAREVRFIPATGVNGMLGESPIMMQVPLEKGAMLDFQLDPFDVFAPDARIMAMADGKETPIPRPTVKLFQGRALNSSHATMFLAVNGADYQALIQQGDETTVIVPSGKGDGTHLMVPTRSVPPPPGSLCQVGRLPEPSTGRELFSEAADQPAAQGSSNRLQARVMINVGYDLYTNAFKQNVNRTVNYVNALLGAVSFIYERDVDVQLLITALNIWQTPDPFVGATPGAQLATYTTYVTIFQRDLPWDIAHLLASSPPGGGGFAFNNVLCNKNVGTGISNLFGDDVVFPVPDSDVIFPEPNYVYDVNFVAHEIGHNFGSCHTNCYNPPIDFCRSGDSCSTGSPCYSGTPVPSIGTIMSLCYGRAGGGINLRFHPRVAAVMRATAERAAQTGCLTIPSSSITVLVPNGLDEWRMYTKQLIQWNRSNITGDAMIELSRDGGRTFETLATDVPNWGGYLWTVTGPPTLQAVVRVSSVNHSSVSDMSNDPFFIREAPTQFQDFRELSLFFTVNGVNGTPVAVTTDATVLRLTNNFSQGGTAFLVVPIPLTTNGADTSFSAEFQFQISNAQGGIDIDGLPGADGLGFAIATSPSSIGGFGGNFFKITPSVVVEFDTWKNGDETSGNHVGIDINGAVRVFQPWTPPLNNGRIRYAWIDYDGSTDLLEIRLSETPARPANPMMPPYRVDLKTMFVNQSNIYFGFVAGTGPSGKQDHDIRFFSYTLK